MVTFRFVLGLAGEPLSLLFGILGAILFEELEEDFGLVFIKRMRELRDDWWYFNPGEENPLLPLEGNVLGPSDKPGEISLGLNIVADSKVPWPAGKEGILCFLCFFSDSLSLFSLNSFYDIPFLWMIIININ